MSIQVLQQQLNQIKLNFKMPNQEFQNIFQSFIEGIQAIDQNDNITIKQIQQAIKRFKRKLENEVKLTQTDYHAFLKKWKTQNITFIPLVYEVKLDFSKKLSKEYEDLINFNFNHHHYTSKEMVQAAILIFKHLDIEQYANYELLEQLIVQINLNYNIVPYHNFTHAFALFQLLFSLYEKSELKGFVQKFDIFAALIASLSHDLNHKGVNNLYKIKKAKSLKININEQAVLESMHSASFFNILSINPNLNFLNKLPDNQQQEFKRVLITSILATDMSQHFNIFGSFQERVQATLTLKNHPEQSTKLLQYQQFKKDNFEDRKFLLNVLVHACDISNPCLEWDSYMKWSYLLAQEFQDQTLKEASKELEITTMLQYKDKLTFFNGQTFFLKTFVQPQWQLIAELYPQLNELPIEIEKNLEILEQEKKKIVKQ